MIISSGGQLLSTATSGTTLAVPEGAWYARFWAIGAGGSGRKAGGGGGGVAYYDKEISATDWGRNLTISIGAGSSGNNGGNTTLSGTLNGSSMGTLTGNGGTKGGLSSGGAGGSASGGDGNNTGTAGTDYDTENSIPGTGGDSGTWTDIESAYDAGSGQGRGGDGDETLQIGGISGAVIARWQVI